MRDLGIESWGAEWASDKLSKPLWQVDFDGVTYVMIYGDPPDELAANGPALAAGFRLGEHIYLQDGRMSAAMLIPGDTLTVALWWRSDGKEEGNYKVFCHIISEDGTIIAQEDGIPIDGVRPTAGWRANEIIEDGYKITLGTDVATGIYLLGVGMYDPDSMIRLPAFGAGGNRLPNDTMLLGELSVHSGPDA
jgi:hypothetical protein